MTSKNSSQRIYSYGDLNRITDNNYDDRPFTDFEIKIFNKDINSNDIDINVLSNVDMLSSLANYYDTIGDDVHRYLCVVRRLLSLGDSRGYLKLGIYLINVANDELKALEIFKIGAKKTIYIVS